MKRYLAPAVTAVTPGRGLPPTTAEQGPLKIPTPVPRYQRDELCSENPSPRGFLFSLIGFSLANAGAGPRLAALPPPTAAPKAWRCERLPDLCPQGPWGGIPGTKLWLESAASPRTANSSSRAPGQVANGRTPPCFMCRVLASNRHYFGRGVVFAARFVCRVSGPGCRCLTQLS